MKEGNIKARIKRNKFDELAEDYYRNDYSVVA